MKLRSSNGFRRILWPTLGLVAVSCGDEPPSGVAPDPLYPTTIHSLEPAELEARVLRFAEANPNLCARLDRFGFPRAGCSTGVLPLGDKTTEALIDQARVTLVENREFTGITSPAGLEVDWYFRDQFLQVDFTPQIYRGLEVEWTFLRVWMDGGGVRAIRGHHYPEIFIPMPRLSAADARARVIGMKLPWYDFGGQEHIYAVAQHDLVEPTEKTVFPLYSEDRIELFVTWRIPVGSPARWYIRIDIATGRLIHTTQLFVT